MKLQNNPYKALFLAGVVVAGVAFTREADSLYCKIFHSEQCHGLPEPEPAPEPTYPPEPMAPLEDYLTHCFYSHPRIDTDRSGGLTMDELTYAHNLVGKSPYATLSLEEIERGIELLYAQDVSQYE